LVAVISIVAIERFQKGKKFLELVHKLKDNMWGITRAYILYFVLYVVSGIPFSYLHVSIPTNQLRLDISRITFSGVLNILLYTLMYITILRKHSVLGLFKHSFATLIENKLAVLLTILLLIGLGLLTPWVYNQMPSILTNNPKVFFFLEKLVHLFVYVLLLCNYQNKTKPQ
jgi:hypothetical protein